MFGTSYNTAKALERLNGTRKETIAYEAETIHFAINR